MTVFELRATARSHVGLVRQGNEDSGYAGHHVFAVADGMGGQVAGEVASRTVIAGLLDLDGDDLGPDLVGTLRHVVQRANERLRLAIEARPDLDGMGTTLTVLAWDGSRLALAHVGDSRAYLLRSGEMSQLTHDQTLVQSLIDGGQISEDEARTHPQRAVILQALDGRADLDVDITLLDADLRDRYLLCSDGLTGYTDPEAVAVALARQDANQALEALIDLALDAGAPDNVTAIIVDVLPSTGSAAAEDPPRSSGILVGAVGETGAASTTPELTRSAAPSAPANASSQPQSRDPLEPAPRRRPRRWIGLLAVLVLVAVLAAGVLMLRNWASDQWYVGVDNGRVAVYSGVDVSIGPLGLSTVEQTTTIEVATLPEFFREEVEGGISAADQSSATEIVLRLQVAADSCLTAPDTAGCP